MRIAAKTKRKRTAALVSESGRILQRWPHKPAAYELLAASLEQQYETNRLLKKIDASTDGAYLEASNVDHRDVLQAILKAAEGLRTDLYELGTTVERLSEELTDRMPAVPQARSRRGAAAPNA